MKRLMVSKRILWLAAALAIAQAACSSGQIVATVMPASPAATPAAPAAASPTVAVAQGSPTAEAPTAAASSGDHATPADAQAMLKAAVEHYQTAGREQALKDFTDKKPPFGKGDLYVVCLGADHKMTANGGYPMFVGLSADALKDPSGKPLGQSVWDVASVVPQGTVPIHWENPLTGESVSKVLYYQNLGQDVCGVAADSGQ